MAKARILTAELGEQGHGRGARLITRILMEAGFEVIYTGLLPTPEAVVRAALQEDVDLLGISIPSESHVWQVPPLLQLLREREMSDVPVVVVVTARDVEGLIAAGVAAAFGPGTGALEIAGTVRDLIAARAERK
jgi:methylmalonyl-CoA mutase C-terminal domain/subunit